MRANHKAACVVRGWFQAGTTLRTFLKLAVRSEAMNSTRKPQTQAVERIEARANEDGKKSPTTMPRGILYQIWFWKGGGGETYVEFLNGAGHLFYLFTLSILSWCSRDLAAQTGDVFWVRVIVPVIKEVMALWSFHPRLTHCSFKNSTPVSAAGLVDPRVSQFGLYEIHVINFWTFRRCLIDTIEISVLGVRWGFDWALIGHIRVGYMSKRLKFYFAMVLLYTVIV